MLFVVIFSKLKHFFLVGWGRGLLKPQKTNKTQRSELKFTGFTMFPHKMIQAITTAKEGDSDHQNICSAVGRSRNTASTLCSGLWPRLGWTFPDVVALIHAPVRNPSLGLVDVIRIYSLIHYVTLGWNCFFIPSFCLNWDKGTFVYVSKERLMQGVRINLQPLQVCINKALSSSPFK